MTISFPAKPPLHPPPAERNAEPKQQRGSDLPRPKPIKSTGFTYVDGEVSAVTKDPTTTQNTEAKQQSSDCKDSKEGS